MIDVTNVVPRETECYSIPNLVYFFIFPPEYFTSSFASKYKDATSYQRGVVCERVFLCESSRK